MSERRVIAVGTPPTFRHQVARALESQPDVIGWVPTVAAAESSLSEGRETPSVLVLSPAIKELDAFGLAEFASKAAPATAVLLVRDRTASNGLLPAAMRAGIRDVIDLSRGGEELREGLRRAIAWSDNLHSSREVGGEEGGERRGAVISVFSSKGGTGKTFLAGNLAVAIAKESGAETAVLDLDLDLGDLFAYFGKEAHRPVQDLAVLPDEADHEAVRQVGTKLVQNVWGFGSPPDPAATNPSGEVMGKVVRALRHTFDYTVIDATTEYSDPVLAAFDLSDRVCLMAALDVVGVRHLSLALQTLLSLGFGRDRFLIALNRADSKVGLTPADVERVMKLKVDLLIPSSRMVPVSLNAARPIVMDHPRSEVSKSIIELARKIATPVEAPVAKRRLFSRK